MGEVSDEKQAPVLEMALDRMVAPPGEYRVAPYGFLTGLRVEFDDPLENMDAGNPWIVELRVRRIRPGPEPIPTVVALVKDLETRDLPPE